MRADMTQRFSVASGIAGTLAASGTLVLFLAACGSSTDGASSTVRAPSTAGSCNPGPSADCSGANLAGANLSHMNLGNANFSYADLSGADLNSANLSGANLHGADLNDADMTGENLKRADLSGANFMGADLSGAINSNLNNASASSAQYVVCHTILPSGRLPTEDC